MRNLKPTLLFSIAVAMQSAFGSINVTNPANLSLTGPALTLPGANNDPAAVGFEMEITGANGDDALVLYIDGIP